MKLTHFLVLSLGVTLGWPAAAASTYDETTGTGTVWAKGVSQEEGWYDANKNDPYNDDADDLMCYAACAANLITWWQNSNYGKNLASADVPRDIDSIWKTYVSGNQLWGEGGDPVAAINWWISGVYAPGIPADPAYPVIPVKPIDSTHPDWERYYAQKLKEDLPLVLPRTDGYYYDQHRLTNENLANFVFDSWIYGEWSKDGAAEIDFRKLFESGAAISLAIMAENSELGHAITLWGVEYENGVLTKLWLTDSDDADISAAPRLFGATVKIGEDGRIYITGTENDTETWPYYGSKDVYIDSVYAILGRESLKWSLSNTTAYVNLQVNPTTHNGRAGVTLLPEVIMSDAPAKSGALASIFEAVDAGKVNDRDASALAGASTTVLGQALAGDMDRQLSAIRNRAGMDNSRHDVVALDAKVASLEQPCRFFAWVNAEGNRAEQNNDGTAAGYTLSSWGATLGAGMQVDKQLTVGLAVTAMYGDLKSDGPDSLDGDMDTTYLSAFARYRSGSWSHSFIGSVGSMEADYTRHAMSYTNQGDTDGTSFGLMYELGREYALSEASRISPLFNVSYRHTVVDSYKERGTNAALNVGKQSLDTVTVALGARYASIVGQQMLNCACTFEARALAKCDFGDTQSEATVGFVDHVSRATIESAERGAMGLELGAGISMPVGSGSLFTDGAVELRNDYTNFNAAVGYKIQF